MKPSALHEIVAGMPLPSPGALALAHGRGGIATLRGDPKLAARVLEAINSSYFDLPAPCGSIEAAAARVGRAPLQSLALGFGLIELSRDVPGGFDLADFWRRGLVSAAAARRIAVESAACDPSVVFSAALLQDVGMLAIQRALGPVYLDLVARAAGNHRMLPHRESAALGYTHADVGARLGEEWGLPPEYVEPLRLHHRDAACTGEQADVVHAVVLGFHVFNLGAAADPRSAVERLAALSKRLFDLDRDQTRAVIREAADQSRGLKALLEVKDGRPLDPAAILSRAGEALARRQREPAATPAVSIDEQVERGIRHRATFEQMLEMRFGQAAGKGEPLSLVLVEPGSGLELPDDALRVVARRLRRQSGRTSVVAPYAAGILGVIVPGAGRFTAARLAERLRRGIEADPVAIAGTAHTTRVHVAAALGVAALDAEVSGRMTHPAMLMKVADNALAAARAAGGNCVRVFKPARRRDPASPSPAGGTDTPRTLPERRRA